MEASDNDGWLSPEMSIMHTQLDLHTLWLEGENWDSQVPWLGSSAGIIVKSVLDKPQAVWCSTPSWFIPRAPTNRSSSCPLLKTEQEINQKAQKR